MKSGLEGRNNCPCKVLGLQQAVVSMKSGLEGRNNSPPATTSNAGMRGLNEVRPRRPEQCRKFHSDCDCQIVVSMKSGLEGRNNPAPAPTPTWAALSVSMKSGLEGRNNPLGGPRVGVGVGVSMKSGLEGRNNGSSVDP